MRLLALDTSSVACSVALQNGDAVLERHAEKPRAHTRLLVPMIRDVLAESGVALGDLDAIVLGNGPGSFIGMRIAASVAQGMAFAAGLRLAPVSSLAAVAAETLVESDATDVVVAQDARMEQVYLGHFSRGEGAWPVAVGAERLHTQQPIDGLQGLDPAGVVAAGYGWKRYPALLEANRRWIGRVGDVIHPRARHLLPLGSEAVRNGGLIDPKTLVPAYLRQQVASEPARSP